MTSIIAYINNRNEETRLNGLYDEACEKQQTAETEQAFLETAERFEAISQWKDAAERALTCRKQASTCKEQAEEARLNDLYDEACEKQQTAVTEKAFLEAAERFEAISQWKDAAERVSSCRKQAGEARLNGLYTEADQLQTEGKLFEAYDAFYAIKTYKDSEQRAFGCARQWLDKEQEKKVVAAGKRCEAAQKALAEIQSKLSLAETVLAEQERSRNALVNELSQVHGLFTGAKKKELQERIGRCEGEAARLTKEIVPLRDHFAAAERETAEASAAQSRLSESVRDALPPTTEEIDLFIKAAAWNVGKTVTYGTYAGEPIEWQVLEVKNDGVRVLMSVKGLDAKPYNTERANVTWETCSLRAWLNSEFYESAFSASEKGKIVFSTVENPDNKACGTKGGNTTKDHVYLLSLDEVGRYFNVDPYAEKSKDCKAESLICLPTQTAVNNDAYTLKQAAVDKSQSLYNYPLKAGACWWWLRSPGLDRGYAAYVLGGGFVDYVGRDVTYTCVCVRPVVCVRL